jgi:nucleoid-associated protein YgaU
MPGTNGQLQKAFLTTETNQRIDCMFNPSKFSFSMSNRWNAESVPGAAAPSMRYAGAQSGKFDLSLVFDTTGTGTAVTVHTNKLLGLLEINTSLPDYDPQRNSGRPPWVTFHWGTALHTFKAILSSLNVTFTYFSSEGTPLRANVDASFEQYEADATWSRQNPTSGTPNPHRTHQVMPGETLDRIAARYYGDSTRWRHIASANGISDPLAVAPGRVLAIPDRNDT